MPSFAEIFGSTAAPKKTLSFDQIFAQPPAAPSPAGVADFLGSYEDPGVPQPDMMAWMEDPVNNPPESSWLPPSGPMGEGVDPNSQNPYDYMQSAYGQQRQGRGVEGAIPAVEGFLGQYGQEPFTAPGVGNDGETVLKYPQPREGVEEYNRRKKAEDARIAAEKRKRREDYSKNFGLEPPKGFTPDPNAPLPYGMSEGDMPALADRAMRNSSARRDKEIAKGAEANVRKMEREYLASLSPSEIAPEDQDRAMRARVEYYENLPLKMTADVFSDKEMENRYRTINEMILGSPLLTTDPTEKAGRKVMIDRMRKEFEASGKSDPVDWYMEQEAKSAGNLGARSAQAFGSGVKGALRDIYFGTGDMATDLAAGAVEGVTGYDVQQQGSLNGNVRQRELTQGWNEGVQTKADEQSMLGGFTAGALRGTAGTLGEMAPMMVGSALTGGGAAAVYTGMGLNVGSKTYGSLRSQGWDRDEALAYAAGASAIEIATERIGGAAAKAMGWVNLEGSFTKQARETFAKAMEKPGLGRILNVLGSSAGEGSEELVASVAGSIHDALWGLDPELFGSKSAGEQISGLAKTFTIGAMAGFAGNGNAAALNFILKPTKENAEEAGIDPEAFAAAELREIGAAALRLVKPDDSGVDLSGGPPPPSGSGATLDAIMADELVDKPGTGKYGQDQAGAGFAKQAWSEVNGEPATPEPTPKAGDTGYWNGGRIEYTGKVTPRGMLEFVYLDGEKQGQTGVKWSDAETKAWADRNQREWEAKQAAPEPEPTVQPSSEKAAPGPLLEPAPQRRLGDKKAAETPPPVPVPRKHDGNYNRPPTRSPRSEWLDSYYPPTEEELSALKSLGYDDIYAKSLHPSQRTNLINGYGPNGDAILSPKAARGPDAEPLSPAKPAPVQVPNKYSGTGNRPTSRRTRDAWLQTYYPPTQEELSALAALGYDDISAKGFHPSERTNLINGYDRTGRQVVATPAKQSPAQQPATNADIATTTPAEPAPPTESGQSPATSGQDTPSVAPPDAPPVATSQAPADSGVAREPAPTPKKKLGQKKAKPKPDAEVDAAQAIVDKAMPKAGGKVTRTADGLRVSFPNGKSTALKFVDEVPATEAEIIRALKNYEIEDTPENRAQFRANIRGRFQIGGKDVHGVIFLRNGLGENASAVMRHELVHFARENGCWSEQEWNDLVAEVAPETVGKSQKVQEEAVARAIQEPSIANRLRDFIDSILEAMGVNVDVIKSISARARAGEVLAKNKLGQKRTPPPVIKAADLKQKLREVATTPEEGDALYTIVEARAKAAGESVDDYVAKRFADVLKANRSESVYLKQLASGKPDALAQGSKAPKPNAEIQFLAEDGRAIIRAFAEGQNFSSLLHELLHVFELDLTDVQRASLDNWLGRGNWTYNGAKPGKTKDGKWNRAAREKFARAGERYFREGKAPTPELEGVFAKFKEWLSSVYKTIKGSPIDVELSPDIRSVLDELFGKKKLGDKKTKKAQEESLPDFVTDDSFSDESPKLDKKQKAELSRIKRRLKAKLDSETFDEIAGMSEYDQHQIVIEADRRADVQNQTWKDVLDDLNSLQGAAKSISLVTRNKERAGKDASRIPGFDELVQQLRDGNLPALAHYADSIEPGDLEAGLYAILQGGKKGIEAHLVGPEAFAPDVLEEYRERLERSPEEGGGQTGQEASSEWFDDEPIGVQRDGGDAWAGATTQSEAESEDFTLSREGSKDTSSVVEPFKVSDESRLPKRKTERQPQLGGLPEDLDESVLPGQLGLFADTLYQSDGKNITSLSNAKVDKDRAALGLPPMMAPMRQANQAAWDEAIQKINEDKEWLPNLVNELTAKPRAVNPVENSALLHRRITLRTEHAKALDALAKANESGNKVEIAAASKTVNERLAILSDFEVVTKNVGSADGRALQARKMFADDDYSLVKMELEARAAKGDDLTQSERAEIKRLQETITRLQAQLLAKEESDTQKKLDLGIDALLGEIKKTQPKGNQKPIDDAPIISAIKAKVRKGEAQDITSLVQRLARYFWQKGVRQREPMTDALHGVLEKLIPGWTREQTRRAFNGYGDFTPVSMDDMTVGIADLKAQDREVMKAEAILAGKPLEKTGLQRREDSNEVRRLKKVTNELKRLHGVVVTDPETQLKSALGARKTYYRHRMADLKHEIDTRQLIIKTKSPSPTDAELDGLIAEYNELKRQHSEVFKKPGLTDEQRLAIAIEAAKRNEQTWITKLENAKKGVFNVETGKKQPVTSAQLEAIQARVEAIRAEVSLLKDLDSALQEQKKVKGLKTALETIEQTIKDGDVDLTQPVQGPDSKEVFELKEKLNIAREQLRQLRELKGVYNERRLTAAKEAAQKAIDSLDARIKAGDTSVQKNSKAGPVDSELKLLRYQRDYLNKVMAEMRNAQKPKKSADEIALAAVKSRMKTRMADLKQRMADGDFVKKPRKKITLDAEAIKAKKELDEVVAEYQKMLAKFEWDQLSDAAKAAKTAISLAANSYDLQRVVRTTGEFSAVLRQGFWTAMAHPLRTGFTAGQGLKAFAPEWIGGGGEKYAASIEEEIFNHPKYDEVRALGLHLTKEDTPLNQKEESLMSRWFGKEWKVKGVNVNPLRPFDRFGRVFLNKVRFESYLYIEKNVTRTGTANADEGKALAKFVNQSTGRGTLGKAGEQAGVLLARIFFSPRYIASRFQLLLGTSMWGGSNRTRRAIAMEYLRMARGFTMFTGMLAWGFAGSDDEDDKLNIELDWRSSDFGKLRIGDTRLDLLAGWAQVGTLIGRFWTGQTKNQFGEVKTIRGEEQEFGGQDIKDVMFNFGRSKLHPAIGTGVNFLVGTDFNGQPTSPWREFWSVFTPMTYPEVVQVIGEHEKLPATAIGFLAIFGLGVQNYSVPPERLHKYAAKQAAQAILSSGRPQQIKKRLGSKEPPETDEEYAKRLANWEADREWSKKWLMENKNTPLVQDIVTEMAKKIPPKPEYKPNKTGPLAGVDLNYSKQVREWNLRYKGAADLVKSLR